MTPPDQPASAEEYEPLTARQVIAAIEKLIAHDPATADLPVKLLDMDGDESSQAEYPWDGLTTHVEIDRFSDEQGLVVLLTAWRFKGEPPAHTEHGDLLPGGRS